MIHALAAIALASALGHGPAAWAVTTTYQAPDTPYAVYLYERDHDLLEEPGVWELRETLRESGDWDSYR
ncbi:hypothetical protein [Caniella muris]|uniref:hypothetical protein n=1 Tax=Caniella muris TaxID=2941502 RepID=UPI00203A59A6|nr:hypothetical protein [Caniella muris]